MSRTEGEARASAIGALVAIFRPNAPKGFQEFLSDQFESIPTLELRAAIHLAINEDEQCFNPVAAVKKRAKVLVAERERKERQAEMNRRFREQQRIEHDVPLKTDWRKNTPKGLADLVDGTARSLSTPDTVPPEIRREVESRDAGRLGRSEEN